MMQVLLKQSSQRTNFQKKDQEMLRKIITAFGLVTLLGSSAGLAASTNEVWEHHIRAWEARSVDEIVSDYSDNSTLVLNNQIFKGRKQIAQGFTRLFEIFDNGTNKIDTPTVFDRFVYITWNFTPNGKQEFFGTDTFVIEEGKIVLQTIASKLYDVFPVASPKNKIAILRSSRSGIPCSWEGFTRAMAPGIYEGEEGNGNGRKCAIEIRKPTSVDNVSADIQFLDVELTNVDLACRVNQDYDERSYRAVTPDHIVTIVPIGIEEIRPYLVRVYDVHTRTEKSCHL